MGKSLKLMDSTTGEKAQNVEFFGSDIEPRNEGTLVINLSGDNVLVQITKDSGTTWLTLGTPNAQTDTVFTTNVSAGDEVNFRTNAAGGFTSDYVRVYFSETQV